jgi:hypothetical protein
MQRGRIEQIALGLIAVAMLPTALQATFMPKSFFDDFPLGRGWVAMGGAAYDEHLVRDVGGLFLALIIVTVWSLWSEPVRRPVAVAWLVEGVLHVVYHAGHLDGFGTADEIGMVGSLAVIPVLALVALWAGAGARTGVEATSPPA